MRKRKSSALVQISAQWRLAPRLSQSSDFSHISWACNHPLALCMSSLLYYSHSFNSVVEVIQIPRSIQHGARVPSYTLFRMAHRNIPFTLHSLFPQLYQIHYGSPTISTVLIEFDDWHPMARPPQRSQFHLRIREDHRGYHIKDYPSPPPRRR